MRRALVVGEVALAVALVIGAGLLLRTVWNLTTVDAGFNRSRLVTFCDDAAARRRIDSRSRCVGFYQRLHRSAVERRPACRAWRQWPACRRSGR